MCWEWELLREYDFGDNHLKGLLNAPYNNVDHNILSDGHFASQVDFVLSFAFLMASASPGYCYKIVVFVFKCFNGMTTEYLSSSLSRHHPTSAGLCSASDSTRLFVHNTTKTLMSAEKRCFSYKASQVWNNLHVNIRDSQSLMSFKRTLKTHLYSHYFA